METVHLLPHAERRCRAGHLWVFSNELRRPLPSLNPGDEVLVEKIMCAGADTRMGTSDDLEEIVTEIPFMVNKSTLIEAIANLVRSGKITGIRDIRDESDKDGMRIVIDLKRDSYPKVVMNQLFKHTQLQTTFGVIMLALNKLKPEVMDLRKTMRLFLEHREEAERFLARRPGSRGMAKMLWDARVATDILAALPEVDADRLGHRRFGGHRPRRD